MRLHDLVTSAGGARANEDRAGQRGSLGWVIDGATDLYEDAALPAESDVQWLVDFVAGRMVEAGEREYRGSAVVLLEDIARQACRQQAAYGFPIDRLPPACSIAIAVDLGGGYEITRIGDATAVVVTGDQVQILATDFFDRRERAAVHDQRGGGTAEQVRTAMLERRRATMTAGGVESVFSGHPERQLQPHTITGGWTGVDHILLCTDGFTRLVSDYHLYPDWLAAAIVARAHGLAYLEKLIRHFERGNLGQAVGRFKHADDVAALLLAPDPSGYA